MSKTCTILIDGSNFYFKLKDLRLQNQLAFDFSRFSRFLAEDYRIIKQYYYIGAVKTDGTKKMAKLHADQQKLFTYLKKHKFIYKLGYLLKDKNDKFNEKGVDVNIAMDIIVNAYENISDRIILVSSDTDLIPAIKQANKLGKDLRYVGFDHMPSNALVASCNSTKLLTKSDIKKFYSKPKKL